MTKLKPLFLAQNSRKACFHVRGDGAGDLESKRPLEDTASKRPVRLSISLSAE